ncbi:hypothetical protein EJ05DRAFT_168356 [Pseudovirgaria hyperparasitica]|uniref:Uncharacterized protein n=1 Tax=Pseudovirgaria hyperparasitica TaxID=470096 RepID=A0A6A6VU55_9PEZI|nr:uncharacterized protein EJ05DRAFT_168356 [Pseudovirgaria hyperparasitica]KAF2753685.1 hypothetical protein EJ05DRAFT_168356 [Pseudovirgaria hyperparasitica]
MRGRGEYRKKRGCLDVLNSRPGVLLCCVSIVIGIPALLADIGAKVEGWEGHVYQSTCRRDKPARNIMI